VTFWDVIDVDSKLEALGRGVKDQGKSMMGLNLERFAKSLHLILEII